VFKVKDRWSAATQSGLLNIYLDYQFNAKNGHYPKVSETGLRVFSQFEEDGKLLYLFSLLGMSHKTFLEIGSDDGINSNSANLYFNFGWTGVFIDGNEASLRRGEYFYSKYPNAFMHKPKFVKAMLNPENLNGIIKDAGLKDEIGFLSIDIDSNDYYIWDAIKSVNPQVVMIETQIAMGDRNIVAPLIEESDYTKPRHRMYHGASGPAMVNLGIKKGYRLVGANELGFNLIFLREDLLKDKIPTIGIEQILKHPSVKEGMKSFESISDLDYFIPAEAENT